MKATVLLTTLVAVTACIDHGPGPQPKPIDPKLIASHLLTAVPANLTHLDVVLGGRVEYVGNSVDREILVPGQSARITHVWQVLIPPGPGWRVFAQLRGEPGTADFMNLDPTEIELGHPVASWRAGEIISDPLELTLRPDWKSKTATLYVGLVRVGGHQLEDRMRATGPATHDDAIAARHYQVDLSKAPPPPGTVYLPHAAGPITIDGIGTEPGYGLAILSPEFATAEGSQDPVGKANAKVTWDDHALYIFVTVEDTDIVSPFTKHDEDLWKADAIEIFIDADSNRRGYVELQVSPANVTFDKWWPQTRAQDNLADMSYESNMQTAVKLRGTVAPGDTDQGWDVEIAIPWAAVKGKDDAMRVNLPPHVGDRWRMNIVRTNQRTGGTHQAEGGASSWNRITVGDFHAMDRMMTVVFADQRGAIVPQPGAVPGAVPVPPVTATPAAPALEMAPRPVRPPIPVRPVDPAIQRAPRTGSGAAAK
ncbi:MAG: carbohydrate-binding family 9-like protein [Kofleriaceae bacterium]